MLVRRCSRLVGLNSKVRTEGMCESLELFFETNLLYVSSGRTVMAPHESLKFGLIIIIRMLMI